MNRRAGRIGPFEDWTQLTLALIFGAIGAYYGYHWLVWLL